MNLLSLIVEKIDSKRIATEATPQVYIEAKLTFEDKECIVKFSGGMISYAPVEGKRNIPELPVALQNSIKNVLIGYTSGMTLSTNLTLDFTHVDCCNEGCELED